MKKRILKKKIKQEYRERFNQVLRVMIAKEEAWLKERAAFLVRLDNAAERIEALESINEFVTNNADMMKPHILKQVLSGRIKSVERVYNDHQYYGQENIITLCVSGI